MAKEHKRCLINFNEILDYNINLKTEAASKALIYLEERKKDMEYFIEERDKAMKKAGKKADEIKDKNPIYEN